MVVEKGYKETNIGLIPEDWEIKTVSKIGSIQGRVGWKGYTVKDLRDSGAYTIGAKHIDKQNRLDLSDPTFLSQEKYLESPEIMVNKNDILIVQRGTIGKVVLIKEEIGEATINPSMLILRLQNSISNYIFYYFISSQGQKQILNDTSSTGVPMITQKQVLAFSVPLPPLPEQTAIANALSDMDALISQTEKLIEKKKGIKQGVMQELLKPKEGWVTKKLGEVCTVIKSGGTPLTSNSEFYNGEIPFLSIGDMTSQGKNIRVTTSHITKLGLDNSTSWIVPKDSIIYSMYASVGFVSINRTEIAISQAVLGIRFRDDINLEFMYYMLKSMQKHVLKFVGEGTQKNLNARTVKNFDIQLPSYKTQIEISEILCEIDKNIFTLETKLLKLKQQKQGMMQALLTGKIRLI